MFELENLGYSKKQVDIYLVELLAKVEHFEEVINNQKEEIKSLEKRVEVLNSRKSANNSNDNEDYIERAKEQADEILNSVLLEINDLDERIHNAIFNELDK